MAAGKGTRMKSDLPKVLHPVGGKPMAEHVLALARRLGSVQNIVVVGHKKELVETALEAADVQFAVQEPQLGTGHAVMQTEPMLQNYSGDVLVLSGDVPLLSVKTMTAMYGHHRDSSAVATVLTTHFDNPEGYGRVVRDASGNVAKIVEHRDASETERQISEINAGIYFFQCVPLFENLKKIGNKNDQGEYYLPDVITAFLTAGLPVSAFTTHDSHEIAGVNTVEQLQAVDEVLSKRRQA